jgi:hypothetical protein
MISHVVPFECGEASYRVGPVFHLASGDANQARADGDKADQHQLRKPGVCTGGALSVVWVPVTVSLVLGHGSLH